MRLRVIGILLATVCLSTAACSGVKRTEVVSLHGAGATFPAPLYHKWFADYQAAHPNVKILYEAMGSGSGIQLFTSQLVDFGASDAAMTDEEIAEAKSGGVQLLPMTAGMVVLAYNVPGVPEGLKLSRDAYVGIFQGKISSWDDPKIKDANPGVALPSLKITAVHRLGASGTTFVFTQHLSAVNPSWEKTTGRGLTVDWPVGQGALGQDGIVDAIGHIPGAIGYLDFGTASRSKLALAKLQNKAGEFVAPSIESCQAALASAKLPENLRIWVPDPAGNSSYPIATFTWILARTQYDNSQIASAVKDVLSYSLTDGQKDCAALGYIQLPDNVRQVVLEAVQKIGP